MILVATAGINPVLARECMHADALASALHISASSTASTSRKEQASAMFV